MSYVRGGDNPRDGSLPASTRDVEATQLEEVNVATQLDVLTMEQEENLGSSSGRLSMTYGGANDPVTVADRSPEIAGANGYHTTVNLWVEGDKQAQEILNLTGEDGEQALALLTASCATVYGSWIQWMSTSGSTKCAAHSIGRSTRPGCGDPERGVADLVHNGFQGRG